MLKDRRTINLWAGIHILRVIGPDELPPRLNGHNFLDFLDNDLEVLVEHVTDEELRNMWFQLDGAPAHWAGIVRDWLDEAFPDRWIGRGGPVPWPPRSPDLNPLDFFLWGYLKERIYLHDYDDFNIIRDRIQEALDTITPEMLERVIANFIRRCRLCIQENGGKFEHLIRRMLGISRRKVISQLRKNQNNI